MTSADTAAGMCASGVTRPKRIVSTTWPSSSTSEMLRATPTISAAGSRLCMPSRYAVSVPVGPRPPMSPAAMPAIRNAPDSSLNPQSSRSAPYTYAAIGARTIASTRRCRRLSVSGVCAGER